MMAFTIVAGIFLLLYFVVAPPIIHWAFRAPRVVEQGTPAQLGLQYQQVSIATENGKHLFAWFIPPPQSSSVAPAVVVLHGWGGNAEMMLPFAPLLHNAGFGQILLDARNHGSSDTDSFSSMVKFSEDLEHSLDWLANQPEIQADQLSVVGHSVGAAAALLVASRRQLAAVVSISTFSHPARFMRRVMASHYIPYIPIGWWVLRYIEKQIKERYDEIAPANTIRSTTCPVLLLHGALDRYVPVTDAETVFNNRNSDDVKLKILADVAHTSTDKIEQYGDNIVSFLKRTPIEKT